MRVIGVDENGLGPILGPLVVTGVAFDAPDYDPAVFWRLTGPDLVAGDSKVVFSRGRLASARAAAQAWLSLFGVDTFSHRSIIAAIGGPLPFRVPCDSPPPACRADATPLPTTLGAPLVGSGLFAAERLATARITPARATCRIACVGALNRVLRDPGANKLRLDFELMVHVVRSLAADADGPVLALCGKVGSTRRYGPWLDGLALSFRTEEERADASTYFVDGLGVVSFIRDADSSHLPVAVASMIGKYVRELAMDRLNAFLAPAGSRRASGYRDRVTARFVEETEPARALAGLADDCFLRRE